MPGKNQDNSPGSSGGAIADSCEIEAEVRGFRLSLNAAPAVTVWGTSELLHRTVDNVLRNAIRFAPPDTAIEIAVASAGSEAHIVVRDYGPGVREEALVRLFEPFYREPSNAEDDRGLGLGLAIARRAVELHGEPLTRQMHAPDFELGSRYR